MKWTLFATLLLCACGDEDDKADDSVAQDSDATDDSAAADGPDLALTDITKDGDTLTLRYCNVGTEGGETTVPLRLMNVDTTQAWERGGHAFPEPDACAESDPVPCADVGLDCAQEVVVEGVVDPYDAIRELDETNNRGTFRL
ncbi:MAG: hypothetical protein H6739_23830 [Alphaproteobacteria bacterium]|nr:hypothetical protein [Alphaproteobacteria bacterium]